MRQWLAFMVVALLGVSSAAGSIDPATFFVRCVKVSPYVTSAVPFVCAGVIKWHAWHAPREARIATMEQNCQKLTNSASLWFEHIKKEFVAVKQQLASISAQIGGVQKVVITAHLYLAERSKEAEKRLKNIENKIDKQTQILYQLLAAVQKNSPDAVQLSAPLAPVLPQHNGQRHWLLSLFTN